jgi:hypothetical protein
MKNTLTRAAFSISVAVLIAATIGSTGHTDAQPPQLSSGSPGFAVEFTDCVESISVTLVPTASARAWVPNQFLLAGEGQPVTPLVVRTARCGGIATPGHLPLPGEIVQIGAVIVPPDFTGDINNYTIWYYTSDARLALRLRQAGVSAQGVPTIDYEYDTNDNSLFVRVPPPGIPRLALSGMVTPSTQPAGSFVANWWQASGGSSVKMSTNVPIINISDADLLLTTNQHNPLGQLIGGSSSGFPIIQQFNTFSAAQLQVAVAP